MKSFTQQLHFFRILLSKRGVEVDDFVTYCDVYFERGGGYFTKLLHNGMYQIENTESPTKYLQCVTESSKV